MRVLLAGLLALAAAPASAEWLYNQQGGAFDDAPMHIAAGQTGAYGFGFRCRYLGTIEAVFITPEQIDADTADMMNQLGVTLLVRADDNEPHRIEGSVESLDGTLAILAEVEHPFGDEVAVPILDEVEGASRRVAVAFEGIGQIFHETEIDVRGSTSAIAALKQDCGLIPGE